jgi:hypothetical protein
MSDINKLQEKIDNLPELEPLDPLVVESVCCPIYLTVSSIKLLSSVEKYQRECGRT